MGGKVVEIEGLG